MNKTGWIIALCVLAQSVLAQTVERTVTAQPRGQVVITNVSGQVLVHGWDREEVQVQGELGEGVKRLEVASEGDVTVVKVVPERGSRQSSAQLSIQVPRHSALVLNTVSADQRISRVLGAQRLQSVSGDIHTELGEGYFEARTVSGDVMAKGTDAGQGVRVNTVSGDVWVEGAGADVDVNSISGDLEIIARQVMRVLLKTVNGDMQLRTALAASAQVQAESVNGDISLHLTKPVNARFEVKTVRGDLRNCFAAGSTAERRTGPGRELRFSQGRADATVLIKTLGGDIDVCD